ncbi:MAG TPA: ribosome biogenesis GTPase YlqF [Gammaproteobacteria bacterium]|nr:ribosome biogenesis GTPase YlqF [Gammaproteobacteria bacterium]
MHIQWYPGHMHKAQKQIRETLARIDLIIEVLDARIPYSSENPMLATLRGDKPCIKILNKHDLADPDVTQQWQDWFEQQKDVKTLVTTTKKPEQIRQLTALCRKILPDRINSNKPVKAMIMGIPNVGKSTLINILAGKIIAKTGNEPAVTKAQQRINLDSSIILVDTPGVLWPNIENRHSGYRLAATGAIRDTAIESTDVAFFAAEYLLMTYPDRLKQRYLLDPLPETELELLEVIGAKRGCLRPGGQIELDKVAKILLTELRAGKLGQISMETPTMVEQEIIKVALTREKKAAKKSGHKNKNQPGNKKQ